VEELQVILILLPLLSAITALAVGYDIGQDGAFKLTSGILGVSLLTALQCL